LGYNKANVSSNRGKRSINKIFNFKLLRNIRREIKDTNKMRDLLYLDFSLENYFRQLVERIIHIDLKFENYIEEIRLVLRNLISSFNHNELDICNKDFNDIVVPLTHSLDNKLNALKIKSVTDRLSRLLNFIIDCYVEKFGYRSNHLGQAFGAEKFVVDIFTEDLIRGTIFFALSMILKKIEGIIRTAAKLGPWQVISPGKGSLFTGNVVYVKDLKEVQFKTYDTPTLLISQHVGGNEEIPINVSCLVIVNSKDYPDILSHVAVRARNLGIPFVVCFDDNKSKELMQVDGKNQNYDVKIIKQDLVEITKNNKNIATTTTKDTDKEDKIVQFKIPEGFPKIVLEINEFTREYLGGKSNNTKTVFNSLEEWIKYPESCAIPFNVEEYFMDLNKDIKEKVDKLHEKLNSEKSDKYSELLSKCKEEVMKLKYVEDSRTKDLKTRLEKLGVSSNEFQDAWIAIKKVWASKYNERAFISTSKIGVKIQDIRMAVLIQKIIPAEYAFVIHTKNPMTNDTNEIYAEVVFGMGETLVGTFEGQSFSFSRKKSIIIFNNRFFIL